MSYATYDLQESLAAVLGDGAADLMAHDESLCPRGASRVDEAMGVGSTDSCKGTRTITCPGPGLGLGTSRTSRCLVAGSVGIAAARITALSPWSSGDWAVARPAPGVPRFMGGSD